MVLKPENFNLAANVLADADADAETNEEEPTILKPENLDLAAKAPAKNNEDDLRQQIEQAYEKDAVAKDNIAAVGTGQRRHTKISLANARPRTASSTTWIACMYRVAPAGNQGTT